MTEMNTGTTLYDMNKSAMLNLPPLNKRQVRSNLTKVSDYVTETNNRYYMMLCHDARDYTVFNCSSTKAETLEKLLYELRLCLENRGLIYSIEKDSNGAIEIWVRGTGYCEYLEKDQFYVYYFFPYDAAIIEV